jgi:hypothetical protein
MQELCDNIKKKLRLNQRQASVDIVAQAVVSSGSEAMFLVSSVHAFLLFTMFRLLRNRSGKRERGGGGVTGLAAFATKGEV